MPIHPFSVATLLVAGALAAVSGNAGVTAGVSPTTHHPNVGTTTGLTRFGYGAIRIGTRPEDLRGYTLTNRPAYNETCYVVGIEEAPGLALLIVDGVIQRVSVGERGASAIRSDRGIGTGSTETAVRRAYRLTSSRTHQYVDPPAKYLTWLPGGGTQGLMFETDAHRHVKVIYAGVMPYLSYSENYG